VRMVWSETVKASTISSLLQQITRI
jgi:hypothetical protein